MLSMVKRIIDLSGKYKDRVILGIIFNVLKSSSVGIMLLSIFILNAHIEQVTVTIIWQAFGMVILSIALQFVFQWLASVMMSAAGYHIFKDKRLEIGARLKRASMGYFSEQNLGNIQTVLTTTASALEEYSMMMVSMILGGIIQASVIIIMLLFFCPPASLLAFIGLITGLLVLRLVTTQSEKYSGEMQHSNEQLIGKSLEFIKGIPVLRSFGKDGQGLKDVKAAFARKKRSDIDSENGIAWTVVLYQAVFKVTSCLMLLLAPLLYISGQINLPVCLALVISAFMIFAGFETMSNGALLSRVINAQLNRLEEVTDFEMIDSDGRELQADNCEIVLADVSFAYGDKKIVDGVSLTIPEKSTCAIIGPSGGGKTTLTRLIARFWDVDEGYISLGGHNVKEYTCEALLSNFSIVFQNVYLFNTTIGENIRFGRNNATDAQVIAAAQKACCHDFIKALPDGYNTMVGEGGHTLSGGEKQRISIARAILKDAPIVILDEATASVDPENESKLLRALAELTDNKTIITIAHRLKTVRDADKIVVLDEGKIVEQGNHVSLMEKEGLYSEFVKMREVAAEWNI